jgi:hypothetical protein
VAGIIVLAAADSQQSPFNRHGCATRDGEEDMSKVPSLALNHVGHHCSMGNVVEIISATCAEMFGNWP